MFGKETKLWEEKVYIESLEQIQIMAHILRSVGVNLKWPILFERQGI